MGGRPVGVGRGKGPGRDDAVAHFLGGELIESQLVQRDGAPRPRQAAIRQVGEDAQQHPPAGDLLDQRRQALQAVLTALAPIASRTS